MNPLTVTSLPAGGPAMMVRVPDMRCRCPEPPAGPPGIQFKPGMASDLLGGGAAAGREGIDVDNIDVPDVETLQRALNRAMELAQHVAVHSPSGRPAN